MGSDLTDDPAIRSLRSSSKRLPLRKRFALAAALLTVPLSVPATSRAAGIVPPPDLLPGESYRVLYVTSGARDANSPNIADYDAFVAGAANAELDFALLNTTWKAIGSTASVDARDHTGTNPLVVPGVPVYTPRGGRLAADNADLWDGAVGPTLPRITELGTVTGSNRVWTGSNGSGTAAATGVLDASSPRFGDPGGGGTWIDSGNDTRFSLYPLYGLSGVLTQTSLGAYVRFSSVVTSSSGAGALFFPPGLEILLTYELDVGVADGNPTTGSGLYANGNLRLSVYSPSNDRYIVFGAGNVQTFDDTPGPGDQLFLFGNSVVGGSSIAGSFDSAELTFIGGTAMLEGEGLPTNVLGDVQSLELTLIDLNSNVTTVTLDPSQIVPISPLPALVPALGPWPQALLALLLVAGGAAPRLLRPARSD